LKFSFSDVEGLDVVSINVFLKFPYLIEKWIKITSKSVKKNYFPTPVPVHDSEFPGFPVHSAWKMPLDIPLLVSE